MLPQTTTGTYTGTGSAVTEATIGSLGYKPKFLKIWNETDGDIAWEYADGLADGYAYQMSTAQAIITSNGITVSNTGFAVGTALSESGKTFRYFATGGI